MAHLFLDGNEATARAAVDAGCRFFAGYPITPATTIYQQMLNLLPPLGGVCLQGEDEIASIGFCIGASMAGIKALTATSGPGISLFSEQISFAIGAEIPLVIIDVQRLGPSTGSATKGADSDICFLRWGNSGGLPVIVLAPADATDCYQLTGHAFNLAERYRCPVFIASNKEIGMTRESVAAESLILPEIKNRAACPEDQEFIPFKPPPGSTVPDFLPIGATRLVRTTSSTHGADGYITTVPEVIQSAIARMCDKLNHSVADFTFFQSDEDPAADTLLIVYGVTARAAREALIQLRAESFKVSLLVMKTLFPVPEALLKEQMAKVERVIVIEMNCGQYVGEIERLCGPNKLIHFGKMNGELVTPDEIYRVAAK
jgi:2-oxoglutarate ferredoxin oxidoreductase subunit alpha